MEAEFCIEALQEALRNMASRKSSTRIRAANSPAPISPACFLKTASPSAWTAKARGVTMSLSSGYGGRSNGKRWCAVETCFAVGQVSFIGDGGRSSEDGLQGQSSNHHKLRGKSSRGERCWKRRGSPRQVCLMKTNVSEPLMTCRNLNSDVETRIWTSILRTRVGRCLLIAQPASGMKAA